MKRICEIDCQEVLKCTHSIDHTGTIYQINYKRYKLECGAFCPRASKNSLACCYLCTKDCHLKSMDLKFIARWLNFIKKLKEKSNEIS